jgi:hypothetical protein
MLMDGANVFVRRCALVSSVLWGFTISKFDSVNVSFTAALSFRFCRPFVAGSGRPRWEKEAPASLDVFGWCSWDACYTSVNPRALQDGLRHLADGGTPAQLLVIDDGWQQMGGWGCSLNGRLAGGESPHCSCCGLQLADIAFCCLPYAAL